MNGALVYLDEQIEAVRTHLRPALTDFDETAVHQSRVATRRLKAGFDVLQPLLGDLNAGPIAKAGRTLRRRLGPLRDLDVMIGHLADSALPQRLNEAVDWVRRHFEAERADARQDNAVGLKKMAKLMARFDDWWRVRHGLEPLAAEAAGPLLASALHARFDAFAGLADRVAGVVASPDDAPPIDIHELRIDGKALRYAFELAAAHGLPVPKRVAKSFKAMQDALGDWHDEVVLAERVLMAVVNADLPLHRPTLAAGVLDVARVYLQRSDRSLDTFKSLWTRGGQSLRTTLAERVPLTSELPPVADASAAESIDQETADGEQPVDVDDAASDALPRAPTEQN